MDRKTKDGSPDAPAIPNSPLEETLELWEPPFDRWLKLTDDLLRNWPTNYPEQRL